MALIIQRTCVVLLTFFLLVFAQPVLTYAETTTSPGGASTTMRSIQLANGHFARLSSHNHSILLEIFASPTPPVDRPNDRRGIKKNGLLPPQLDLNSPSQKYFLSREDIELAQEKWLSHFQSSERGLDRWSFCESLLSAVAAATTIGLVRQVSTDTALNITVGFLGGVFSRELIHWLSKPLRNKGAEIELKWELTNSFARRLQSIPEPVQNQLAKMTVDEFLQAVESVGIRLHNHPNQAP